MKYTWWDKFKRWLLGVIYRNMVCDHHKVMDNNVCWTCGKKLKVNK